MRRDNALAAVLTCMACVGCRAVVLSGLDEAQAGEAVRALDAARIAAHAERETGAATSQAAFRVEVPQTELAQALSALQAAGLPRRAPSGLDTLEQGAGLITTPEEERGRLEAARAAELSRSLSRLPGVLDARVHVSQAAPRNALDREPAAAKAGVLLVRAHGAAPLPEDRVRALVAAGIPALSPEAVTILQVEAPVAASRPSAMVAVGPLSVSRGSAATLRAWLGAALVVNLLLAAALIAVVARKRAGLRSGS